MAALVAISLIVPGVFGITPPQYFGVSGASEGIAANVVDPVNTPVPLTENPAPTSLAIDSVAVDAPLAQKYFRQRNAFAQ